MSPTYKTTGINLKSMPLGESDRLLTILTRECGLVRAVAPGSRKHRSKLGGHSALFVVNSLLMSKGRTIDKIAQAEALEAYVGLSRDLEKLTAAQYLAELAILQALSEQPQEELFVLLNVHLKRLEECPKSLVLIYLTHAIFQLLILAGIAPQIEACCSSQVPVVPNFSEPNWTVGFSSTLGGIITLSELNRLSAQEQTPISKPKTQNWPILEESLTPVDEKSFVAIAPTLTAQYVAAEALPLPYPANRARSSVLGTQLSAVELAVLQHLREPELPKVSLFPSFSLWDMSPAMRSAWLAVEKVLRLYIEYHFDRPIRSAALIDSCFRS